MHTCCTCIMVFFFLNNYGGTWQKRTCAEALFWKQVHNKHIWQVSSVASYERMPSCSHNMIRSLNLSLFEYVCCKHMIRSKKLHSLPWNLHPWSVYIGWKVHYITVNALQQAGIMFSVLHTMHIAHNIIHAYALYMKHEYKWKYMSILHARTYLLETVLPWKFWK